MSFVVSQPLFRAWLRLVDLQSDGACFWPRARTSADERRKSVNGIADGSFGARSCGHPSGECRIARELCSSAFPEAAGSSHHCDLHPLRLVRLLRRHATRHRRRGTRHRNSAAGAALATVALLIAIRFVRNGSGTLLATLSLYRFFWALPTRYHTFFHDYESLQYIGVLPVLALLALQEVHKRLGEGCIRHLGGLCTGAIRSFERSNEQHQQRLESHKYSGSHTCRLRRHPQPRASRQGGCRAPAGSLAGR